MSEIKVHLIVHRNECGLPVFDWSKTVDEYVISFNGSLNSL